MAILMQGFRPFFLMAGILAPLGVGLWALALTGLNRAAILSVIAVLVVDLAMPGGAAAGLATAVLSVLAPLLFLAAYAQMLVLPCADGKTG